MCPSPQLTFLLIVCLAFLLPAAADTDAGAAESRSRQPLPMLNESGHPLGLSRRVVSRPDAAILTKPEGGTVVDHPGTFSTHYIFGETQVNGKTFYEVGPPGRQPTGWLPADEAIEWPNNVSLVVKVPVERYPAMFFENQPGAVNFRTATPLGTEAEALTRRVASGTSGHELQLETGLAAVESDTYTDWMTNFYLMPVLDFEPVADSPDGDMYLETAVIPATPNATGKQCGKQPSVAIVFVIDTTKSMQPYIDRTRATVEKMVAAISKASIGGRVQFGLVGFRDDPAYDTGIQYLTRTFQTLDPNSDPASFRKVIGTMNATQASTRGFSEDALAGILDAIHMDWSPYQGKWIVLITDASPHESHVDSAGVTHTVSSVSSTLWNTQKIGLMSIHLKTPEARAQDNMQAAQDRLEALARWTDVDTAYYAIDNGDLTAFGSVIDDATTRITGQITQEIGQLQQGLGGGDAIDRIGYAQRVIWLGQCQNATPSVLEGWTVRNAVHKTGAPPDVVDKELIALEPRLLLNRQQLDNLVRVLETLYESAQQSPQSTDQFFKNLVTNLMVASLDANQLSMRVQQYRDIDDYLAKEVDSMSVLLPSYATLIPFKSDFLTMTPERWKKLPKTSRDRLIQTLHERIGELKTLYNSKGWVKLHKDSSHDEEVMPILTNFLP